MEGWYNAVVRGTEVFLGWRKKRRHIKREKQKKKHPVVDWVEAFLWAALVVLLINQYVFQAYQIPSGSMMNTLLIQDRIFVNKFIYGPELLPGKFKIDGFTQPKRSEVIIFENPAYISKGTAFDILQRVLYMVTLSFVDIDRDADGNPRAHFLIKRAVGMPGDRIRFEKGEVELMPPGTSEWKAERSYPYWMKRDFTIRRLVSPDTYGQIQLAGMGDAYEYALLPVSDKMRTAMSDNAVRYEDVYAWNKYRARTLYAIYPQERRYGTEWRKADMGWYIPDGYVFPLGDNRDNSRDARYFGPVQEKKVLGRAMFIYWPVFRIGSIR